MSSFFLLGATQRVGTNNQLAKMGRLIDWDKIAAHLTGIHKNEVLPQGGPKAYDNLGMFKALLLAQWHSLSDPGLEEALRVRLDFMLFTGFEIAEDVPDETTLCRFRNKLIQKGLDQMLFDEINRQLEAIGLKVKKAEAAIVDATIITSQARPRTTISAPAKDREEPETNQVIINKSADPDAAWLVKGKKCFFGYKSFVATDGDKGFINHVHLLPANHAEGKELERIIRNLEAERVIADKAYASKSNTEMLKSYNMKDGILKKKPRGKNFSWASKQRNKLLSSKRFIVEQAFGTLKRRFRFARASYMGIKKVEGQMRMKAMCFNLLKAINLVEFA